MKPSSEKTNRLKLIYEIFMSKISKESIRKWNMENFQYLSVSYQITRWCCEHNIGILFGRYIWNMECTKFFLEMFSPQINNSHNLTKGTYLPIFTTWTFRWISLENKWLDKITKSLLALLNNERIFLLILQNKPLNCYKKVAVELSWSVTLYILESCIVIYQRKIAYHQRRSLFHWYVAPKWG